MEEAAFLAAVQASYGLGRLSLDEADPDLALEHFAAA